MIPEVAAAEKNLEPARNVAAKNLVTKAVGMILGKRPQ